MAVKILGSKPGRVVLDRSHHVLRGAIPAELAEMGRLQFERMWQWHPTSQRMISIHGKRVAAPRWDQAYGKDYTYSGQVNRALAIPELLLPFTTWIQESVDQRLNGVLLNWYDAALGHYIGPHRDSTRNMVVGSPIVTLSLGEERIFRMRPCEGEGYVDLPAAHGSLTIIPYATNIAWKHEVPKFKRYRGRRISITLRAFSD